MAKPGLLRSNLLAAFRRMIGTSLQPVVFLATGMVGSGGLWHQLDGCSLADHSQCGHDLDESTYTSQHYQ